MELDKTIVKEGYPIEPGLHLLWSDHSGWPVIDIVRVQVNGSNVTWWRGVGGTDRHHDIPRMFQFPYNGYLGNSRISPEAVAHYEIVYAAAQVKAFLGGEST